MGNLSHQKDNATGYEEPAHIRVESNHPVEDSCEDHWLNEVQR